MGDKSEERRVVLDIGRTEEKGVFWTFEPMPGAEALFAKAIACFRERPGVHVSNGGVLAYGPVAVTIGENMRTWGLRLVDKVDVEEVAGKAS